MTKRKKLILITLLIVILIGAPLLIVSQTNKKSNQIIQRHNNETKKILKESLEWKNLSFYRRSTNVAKKCNNKVISKCDNLYKISERKDENWNIYNIFSSFVNEKTWLKITNLVIDNDTTINEHWKYIENVIKKINDNELNSFETITWEWNLWIKWFFIEW